MRTAGHLLLLLAAAGPVAHADDQQTLVKQISALDDRAKAAYADGDFAKMKEQLLKALSLGRDALDDQPAMARVYLHLGVLYVDGLDNRAVGVKYFAKALKARPDTKVPPNMATKTVVSAFNEAGRQQSSPDQTPRPPTTAEKKSENKTPAHDGSQRSAEREGHLTKAAMSERCHSDAEVADVKRQARDEFDRLEKALTISKDALNKERGDSERYRKDKMDLERALNEAKQRVNQLEDQGRQKDKRAAQTAEREKKERDAREALEREKVDKDSLILDTAQRVQQLEKESSDKDKLIAAAEQREKKATEANDKLKRERESIGAREHERKAWEDAARIERDKLEALPPVPSRIPEPLHCALPDEVPAGADLFVQCITQPALKSKTILFYFRPQTSTVYNALVMDPTKKGWSRAMITANKLIGKQLQYYAEALDGRDSVVATNGRANSPNVVVVAPPARAPSR
jgi:hypothetical protein